jgi:Protein of unknown function (DUF3891)
MIRRDEPGSDPDKSWLLIPQIEHARLSGLLAEHWIAAAAAPLEPRDELIEAVYHHDDGWADWDRRPDVDPRSGRPLQFTEMPLAESLGIWQQSIDMAAARGNLQAYVVSGHFCALLRWAAPRWQNSKYTSSLAERFLDEQDHRRRDWLQAWAGANPSRHTAEIAERGLAWLQFFDGLSLWFCCADRGEPQVFDPPDGRSFRIAPNHETWGQFNAGQFTAAPWPLDVTQLEWSVSARRIPISHYADRAALAGAAGGEVTMHFRLAAPKMSP